MIRRRNCQLLALAACFLAVWTIYVSSKQSSHASHTHSNPSTQRQSFIGKKEEPRQGQQPRLAPRLVWHKSEKTHPYYLSPVLQFEHDTHRRRSTYNLTGMESLYTSAQNTEKLIVFHSLPEWHTFESRYKNSLRNCRVQSCKLSADKALLPKADGVIFYALAINRKTKPPPRPKNQMWTFFNHEPPVDFPLWRNLFNWTLTYRFDSDIVCPYSVLLPKPFPDKRDFLSIAKKKSSMSVWMVTKCKTLSKRGDYVKKLQEYISVDIYGACGPLKCPRSEQEKCDKMLNEKYKFYLAFENSLCRGYLTEKVLRCYDLDIIPVVRGGAMYSELLPQGTYINTADFSSPKELSDHLKYLDSNDTAYAEILQKKSQFTLSHPDSTLDSSLCDMCVKLHDLDRFSNSYDDINKWWNEGVCSEATDF